MADGEYCGMSTLEEFESRIAAAMERIAAGLGAMSDVSLDGSEDLQAALDEEKLANAQLQERVRKLTERHDIALEQIRVLDLELQRLRKSTDQLREANSALREANATGVGDPHLINKSMLTELEALRATRAVETAEATAILSAINTLLASGEASEETAHA